VNGKFSQLIFLLSLAYAVAVTQSCADLFSLDSLFGKTSMEDRVSDSLSSAIVTRTISHPTGAYRVVAVADSHVAGSSWESGERLAAWIASTASSSTPVRALLIAGDLTNSATEEQYAAVKSVLDTVASSAVAVLPVIGNHDLYTAAGWTLWKQYVATGSSWYPSVGYASFVDSSATETLRVQLMDSADCAVGSTQLSYLKGSLTASAPNIVLSHAPLFPGYDNSIWYLESDYERLSILQSMLGGDAPLYITGHDHTTSVISSGTVTQVIVGGYCDNRAMLVITVDPTAGLSWALSTVP